MTTKADLSRIRSEAGRKGGLTTLQRHGRDHFSRIGAYTFWDQISKAHVLLCLPGHGMKRKEKRPHPHAPRSIPSVVSTSSSSLAGGPSLPPARGQ